MRTGSYISQGGNGILVRGIQSAVRRSKQFERKRLDEIAKSMNTDPAEAALRLFAGEQLSPIAIFFGLSEDDLKLAHEAAVGRRRLRLRRGGRPDAPSSARTPAPTAPSRASSATTFATSTSSRSKKRCAR